MPVSRKTKPSLLAQQIAQMPRLHTNDYPLWQGPCGAGPLGGITQSMLVRFLSCRERFRLKYVLGLEPHDRWEKNFGYGNMWHACEESLANGGEVWDTRLIDHTDEQLRKYPLYREEITKWYHICRVQFPEYIKYWAEHPDVQNRTPLMQEQVFDVPYTLPSGRVVRLRGKFDSVDLIDGGIWLQENKTKGDIDKQQVERQLKFDLQTMMYIVALQWINEHDENGINIPDPHFRWDYPILGVRYNVVRRPLSGGIGNIKPHQAKQTKTTYSKKDGRVLKQGTYTPAESDEEFYERLRRDYISADPDHWFFRVKSDINNKDIEVFCRMCLDPLLETLCFWYDEVTENSRTISRQLDGYGQPIYGYAPMNYRTPFGVWSALEEGGATEYDSYLENGNEAGLRRVETLFGELQ